MAENSWDRLPQESDRQWQAFNVYLHNPKPRPSLYKWCKKFDISYSSVRSWSAMFSWKDRIFEYDNYVYQRQSDIEIGVDETQVVVAKSAVKAAEQADYDKLRDGWQTAVDRVLEQIKGGEELDEAINNLNTLALARQRIQVLARRAAEMPFTYSARDEAADKRQSEPSGEIFLDFNEGPQQVIAGRLALRQPEQADD